MKYLKWAFICALGAAILTYAYSMHRMVAETTYNTRVSAWIADKMLLDFCTHQSQTTARTYVSCQKLFQPSELQPSNDRQTD